MVIYLPIEISAHVDVGMTKNSKNVRLRLLLYIISYTTVSTYFSYTFHMESIHTC